MCVCVAMCGEIREDAARAAMDREVEVLGRLEGKALTRIVCLCRISCIVGGSIYRWQTYCRLRSPLKACSHMAKAFSRLGRGRIIAATGVPPQQPGMAMKQAPC